MVAEPEVRRGKDLSDSFTIYECECTMKRAPVVAIILLTLVAFVFTIAPSHAGMSKIQGTVYWYDQFGNLRPLAWAQVTSVAEDGTTTVASTTTDGTYIMWVPPGTYTVTASLEPGFITQSHVVVVSDGGVAGGVDFQLEQSGEPIPEYPSWLQPFVLIAAILAAFVMIRRRVKVSSRV